MDGRPASLLAFEGRSQVHGLFEWLLAEAARGDGADVPSLLAPVPFLGASIQQLQPRVGAHVSCGSCAQDWSTPAARSAHAHVRSRS